MLCGCVKRDDCEGRPSFFMYFLILIVEALEVFTTARKRL